MKQFIFLILFSLLLMTASISFGQSMDAPKREFRGIWVATVVNLDYPSSKNLDSESQKQEWIKLLDEYKALGLNAVIFQVRPAGDAFYESDLVPWSGYLTGKQGVAPVPYYDPLAFLVEEAHKRGIEFHAWFNPYRATMNAKTDELASSHMYKQRPDWFVEYGGKYYFNPAIEGVRKHIVSVVQEVVKKYDIDAVHFDDYFYPYQSGDKDFPDDAQFKELGKEFSNKGDWRRYNVDLLIEELSKNIKATKPHVQFGISPFGVWRNESLDPVNGSATRAGINSYDDLNADILKWLELGWIDYVAPQLYWYIGFSVADYKILVDWWSKRTYGRQLYIGHAAYKIGNDSRQEWNNAEEMPSQIRLNRQTPNVQGSIFFRSKSVLDNPLNFSSTLKKEYYKTPALLPEATFLGLPTANAPRQKWAKNRDTGILLRWKPNRKDATGLAAYYAIYRFEKGAEQDFDKAKNLLAVTPMLQTQKLYTYIDTTATDKQKYVYVIRPVNRQHSEGLASKARKKRRRE